MNSLVSGTEQLAPAHRFRSLFIVLSDLEPLSICTDRLCPAKTVVFFLSIADFENNFTFSHTNLNTLIVTIETYQHEGNF